MRNDERETAAAIDERATAWAARLDAGVLDPQAAADLQAWLAADGRHRGALIRVQAIAHMLSTGQTAPAVRPPPEEPPAPSAPSVPVTGRQPRPDRRRFLAGAGAACATLAAAVLAAAWSRRHREIETALGEVRRLPLNDGSLAAINTETKLAIEMRDNARNVKIEHGEVWFEVARDPARPFTVAAGDVRVRAIGTAFSVQRKDGGADVQVTEGTVEVWSVGNEANRKSVTAGARTFATNAEGPADPVEASIDIDRALSWREGNLALDGHTLGEAAEQFNRYNAIKLEVAPELRDEPIVGRFRINEPDAFARAAATMLGAHVTRRDDAILLSHG